MTNCPSAPMFHTLARKHSARPSAIRISGVALMDSSDRAYRFLTGSTKNICRPRHGSLPSRLNSTTPISIVNASASSGEASDISFEGCGRASSRSMGGLRGFFV